MSKIKLPKELEDEFVLVDWPGNSHCQLFGKFGKVDLSLLKQRQAERLVRMKFPYIHKKDPKPEAAKEEAPKPKPEVVSKSAKK